MKRLLSLSALTLALSSCSFGTLHPTLFNNQVLDLVNPTTLSIEASAITYNTAVPDDITELSVIETEALREDFETSDKLLKDVNKALEFESENLEQQATVLGHLETYISAGENYLEDLEATLLYLENAEHQSDPNRIDTLDPELHASYNTFIEANNDLATSLAEFVKLEE